MEVVDSRAVRVSSIAAGAKTQYDMAVQSMRAAPSMACIKSLRWMRYESSQGGFSQGGFSVSVRGVRIFMKLSPGAVTVDRWRWETRCPECAMRRCKCGKAKRPIRYRKKAAAQTFQEVENDVRRRGGQ
jgi:hypothetical protein